MKRNVDLTENRLFTTPEEPTGTEKLLWDLIKDQSKKPWEFNFSQINSDLDIDIAYPPLIATGDKNDRERWYRSKQERSDEICGHCGKSRGKLPWAKKQCGCSYLMKSKNKFPWDFN